MRKYVPRKPVLSITQRSILLSAARTPLRLNKCRYGPERFNLGSVLRLRDRGWLSLVSDDGAYGISYHGYDVLKSSGSDFVGEKHKL